MGIVGSHCGNSTTDNVQEDKGILGLQKPIKLAHLPLTVRLVQAQHHERRADNVGVDQAAREQMRFQPKHQLGIELSHPD